MMLYFVGRDEHEARQRLPVGSYKEAEALAHNPNAFPQEGRKRSGRSGAPDFSEEPLAQIFAVDTAEIWLSSAYPSDDEPDNAQRKLRRLWGPSSAPR